MHTLESKGACGMGEQIRLLGVTDEEVITQKTDPEFWSMLQQAILLGLKDKGILSEMQYRHAEKIAKEKSLTD